MGVKRLESYLYKEFNIVGVAPTQNIQLFDVLVKIKKGFSVHLENLGSFLLGSPQFDSHHQNGEFSDRIKQGLKELDKDPYEGDLDEEEYNEIFTLRIDYAGDITQKVYADVSLGAKVLHYLSGDLGTSKTMDYRLVSPAYLAIKDEVLHKIFVGVPFGQGLWKPNMEYFNHVHNLARERDGGLEMWIVKEKVYSESFQVNVAKNNSAGLSAAAHEIAPGVEVGVHANQTQGAIRHVTGKYLVGFRAIRLFYDRQGILQEWSKGNMGRHRPTVRKGDETCDEFNDPAYHLGPLFAQPPSEEDEDTSLTCLDIEPTTSSVLPPSDAPERD